MDSGVSIPRSAGVNVTPNGGIGMSPQSGVGMGQQGVGLSSPPGLAMGQSGMSLPPMSSPAMPSAFAMQQTHVGYRGPHAMNGGQPLGLPGLDGGAYGFGPTGVGMHTLGGIDTTPDIAAYLAFLNGGSDPSLGLGSVNGYGMGDSPNPQMYDPRLVNSAAGL
jgi:hypothetical protein